MNASRTEDDLHAALVELSRNAPAVADVLPQQPGAGRPRRPLRWLAPAGAAAVAAAVAIAVAVIGHGPTRPPAAGGNLAALVGVQWQLRAVDGRPVPFELALQIEPNGRFAQRVGQCSSLLGHAALTPTHIEIQHVRRSLGLCPAVPGIPSPRQQRQATAAAHAVQGALHATLSWAVTGKKLVLSRPGEATLRYTRAPNSPARTRQWTFHGVGITLPRAWPKNALRCATPITNTVIYPGPVNYCWARRPTGVTAVEFAPYRRDNSVLSSVPGEPGQLLIDGVPASERLAAPTTGPYSGLQVAEIQIPSRNTTITITSPHRTEAAQLIDELYIVGH